MSVVFVMEDSECCCARARAFFCYKANQQNHRRKVAEELRFQ